MGNNVVSTSQTDDEGFRYVDSGAIKSFRSSGLSFIERVYEKKHPQYSFDDWTYFFKNATIALW